MLPLQHQGLEACERVEKRAKGYHILFGTWLNIEAVVGELTVWANFVPSPRSGRRECTPFRNVMTSLLEDISLILHGRAV